MTFLFSISFHLFWFGFWHRFLQSCRGWYQTQNLPALASVFWDYRHVPSTKNCNESLYIFQPCFHLLLPLPKGQITTKLEREQTSKFRTYFIHIHIILNRKNKSNHDIHVGCCTINPSHKPFIYISHFHYFARRVLGEPFTIYKRSYDYSQSQFRT